ncbi:hypothetical protein SEPCBS119000_004367 [Sporothrix epigloea]|uniref:EKC/KEOPS complex subunit BUD32 n=1 Tax=Sporothrix epigloea TaxID=1892477 RepID=A0ABP0DUN0_9PEZI
MKLTAEELNIIAENPLGDLLAQIGAKLSPLQDLDEVCRTDIENLLLILFDTSAAHRLHCRHRDGTVAAKLFTIRQNVRTGSLELTHFRQLIGAITAKSPDTDVWSAVLELINDTTTPSRLQPSVTPSGCWTPVKASSSRLGDSETRDMVERELFREFKDCTHRRVPKFFEKHFDMARWTNAQQEMLSSVMANHNGQRWVDFPADPWESSVWRWLQAWEGKALAQATYVLHRTKTATEFKSSRGQLDLFFQKPAQTDGPFEYKHVMVVGEHKRSSTAADFKACFLQLSRHVRSVYASQPTRRFIHAFTLRAAMMELWIYDRSGAYSSGEFDIHHEPEKLARALVAYATMDEDALGLDRAIEWENNHRHVTVKDTSGEDKRVELNRLMLSQRAVVCRGTTCFTSGRNVAKFSWRSEKRQPSEVELLKLAQERDVEGVAKLIGHFEITSIADLRRGLEFSSRTQHTFRAAIHDQSGGLNLSPDSKSRVTSRKRNLSDSPIRVSKRQRISSRKSEGGQASSPLSEANDEANQLRASSYAALQDDPYENRILTCLVISPAGRVISDFRTLRELLEALRDAIRAHRSLYVKGGILHRDISTSNIIITSPTKAAGFKGMLIDLDMAKVRDNGSSGADHRTGTVQFMAIEVLRGVDHTYRHDLESFFYVLIWLCARDAWEKVEHIRREREDAPQESKLRRWEVGSFQDIAHAKLGDMGVNSLVAIMDEFPKPFDKVKPLCLRIRDLLFPQDDAKWIMTGTPAGDPDQLYDPIIAAFSESIDLC